MNETCDLSVVVLSWNTKDLTLAALRAVPAAVAPRSVQVLCVDNASADGSADAVEAELPSVLLIRNAGNLGFARGNNAALPHVRGRYVCFLNSDTEAAPGALTYVVDYLDAHPDVGIACPRLVYPDGRRQRAAWRFVTAKAVLNRYTPFGWFGFAKADARRVRPERDAGEVETTGPSEAVAGACLTIRRDLCDRLGGFDPGYPFYFEDVDLCWRAHREGVGVHVVVEGPPVVHHGGASSALAKGATRLPLLIGILRFMRRTHSPLGARLFSITFKVGVVVRSFWEIVRAPFYVVLRRLRGRHERAARTWQTARDRVAFVRKDLWAFLRS